jgi:hypothetical protein
MDDLEGGVVITDIDENKALDELDSSTIPIWI